MQRPKSTVKILQVDDIIYKFNTTVVQYGYTTLDENDSKVKKVV